MKIRLLDDKVLVQAQVAETKTKTGIIIPTAATERPFHGTIILTGPGTKAYPIIPKQGDEVIYQKHAGVEVIIDGNKYLIMTQKDILAIL